VILFYAFDREMLSSLGYANGNGVVNKKQFELKIEKELKELIFLMPIGERIVISPSFLYESKVCRDILKRNRKFLENGLIVKYMQELSDIDFREKKQISYKNVMKINSDYTNAYMSHDIFDEVKDLEIERIPKHRRIGLSSRDAFLPEIQRNAQKNRIPKKIINEVQKITAEAKEDVFLWEAEEEALLKYKIGFDNIRSLRIREAMSKSYLHIFSDDGICIPSSFVSVPDTEIISPQYNAWMISNIFQRLHIEELICAWSAEVIIDLRLRDDIQFFLEIIRNGISKGEEIEIIIKRIREKGNIVDVLEKIVKEEREGTEMDKGLLLNDMTKKILHLSDLHLSNEKEMMQHYNFLKLDLIHSLNLKKIDFLVISGDICDRPEQCQYDVAVKFLKLLCAEFNIDKENVIVVPGNHDCEREISKQAYDKKGEKVVDILKYQERYKLFSECFYKSFYGAVYPLENNKQWRVCKSGNICIVGLNSCFQIDHINTNHSAISMEAIFDCPDFMTKTPLIKFAVWHHPIMGEDSIKDTDFLDNLAIAGFSAFFHGHIHEATNQNFYYDDTHAIRAIGAGTFGAKKRDRAAGIPLQYNLIEIDINERFLIVHTRKREKDNKPWEADARWGDKAHSPKENYSVNLRK
jgi:hypothetical protein